MKIIKYIYYGNIFAHKEPQKNPVEVKTVFNLIRIKGFFLGFPKEKWKNKYYTVQSGKGCDGIIKNLSEKQ